MTHIKGEQRSSLQLLSSFRVRERGVRPIGMDETMRKHAKQWPMRDRVVRQAQHMDDVMERLGVDAALAARQDEGRALARARAVCLVCPLAKDCERWLAQAVDRPKPPGFCPNAAFFSAFLRRRAPVPRED